jgi:hypothetical protein
MRTIKLSKIDGQESVLKLPNTHMPTKQKKSIIVKEKEIMYFPHTQSAAACKVTWSPHSPLLKHSYIKLSANIKTSIDVSLKKV